MSLGLYLKYNPDGSVDRYKVRPVAKGYTQTNDIDYFENALLYRDLQEEVYME